MEGMPAGSMSMGQGIPSLFTLQQMYWAVVGSVIGAATLVNILNRILEKHRLHDSSLTPAKPKSLFFSIYATITATVREISYANARPIRLGGFIIHFPPLGPVLLMIANLIVVMVLCFYKLDPKSQSQWENVGYRTGFIAICQLPLIFLLAGRQNIIGFLAGMSYASLNWYHRWVARIMWLTSTIHFGFWLKDYMFYDFLAVQMRDNPIVKRGVAAWAILTFIVVTSFAPIRRLSYEVFVIQHLVTFIGFIVAVWMHAQQEVKIWVWIPIGLMVFDRVARYTWSAYANLAIFHRQSNRISLWKHSATFTPLPGNVTRVTIENPGVRWHPGQHVFLTCHSVVPLQCHPFTIASLPEDKKMELFIRAENGGTRRFFQYASKVENLMGQGEVVSQSSRSIFIEGPYGNIRPLGQFDSVVLLAGGMGATFTMPLLRDIVSAWKMESTKNGGSTSHRAARLAVTKRLRFVWVVKSHSQLTWFESQLHALLADVEECRRTEPDFQKEIELSIYITCDEKLDTPVTGSDTLPRESQVTPLLEITGEKSKKPNDGKEPKQSVSAEPNLAPRSISTGCCPDGGCCCTAKVEDEDEDQITAPCSCSSQAMQTDFLDIKSARNTLNTPFDLHILSGRPNPKTIIRKVLEKAEGESAVAVCGPHGLADDVRRSVVSLSDERAVHKGTGAQGIYLHVEHFGL